MSIAVPEIRLDLLKTPCLSPQSGENKEIPTSLREKMNFSQEFDIFSEEQQRLAITEPFNFLKKNSFDKNQKQKENTSTDTVCIQNSKIGSEEQNSKKRTEEEE
jgi:hypothetical protein